MMGEYSAGILGSGGVSYRERLEMVDPTDEFVAREEAKEVVRAKREVA
jgi:hypothetical protein